MEVEKIITDTVEKAVAGALGNITDLLVESFSESIKKPKYSLDDLLTEQEVSDYLQIALPTLRQWRSKKKFIPYIVISSKALRYRFEDVYKFLLSKQVRVIDEPNKKYNIHY